MLIIRVFLEQIKTIDVNYSQMAPQDLQWLRHQNEFSEENNIGLMIMGVGVKGLTLIVVMIAVRKTHH